jgi:hypothetical protein
VSCPQLHDAVRAVIASLWLARLHASRVDILPQAVRTNASGCRYQRGDVHAWVYADTNLARRSNLESDDARDDETETDESAGIGNFAE